jgi:5'-3' exonuclease
MLTPPEQFDELLLDGDLLVFSSCAAIEYGNEPADVEFGKIANNIDSRIMNMKNRLGAKKVVVLFSGKQNFRFVVQPDYKANRADAWIPFNLDNAKAYVDNQYGSVKRNGLEADDWCAILQDRDPEISTVIATIDKDIPQIRGWHYRWETQHAGEKLFHVSGYGELECQVKSGNKKKITGHGRRFFFLQLLTGDPTDGIMGCGKKVRKTYKTGKKAGQEYSAREGVGAVKAYNLLEHAITPAKCLHTVMQEYKKVFGKEWQQQLIMNGRCLHMVDTIKDDNMIPLWTWHQEINNEWDAAEFLEITKSSATLERVISMCNKKINESWFDIDNQKICKLEG